MDPASGDPPMETSNQPSNQPGTHGPSVTPQPGEQALGTALIGGPLIKTSSSRGAPKSASLMKENAKLPETRPPEDEEVEWSDPSCR